MNLDEEVNGIVEIKDGKTFWMGNEVLPCSMCGISVTAVDDCGEFGNPDCPYFGIGLHEFNLRNKISSIKGILKLSNINLTANDELVIKSILEKDIEAKDIIKELVAHYKNVNKICDIPN